MARHVMVGRGLSRFGQASRGTAVSVWQGKAGLGQVRRVQARMGTAGMTQHSLKPDPIPCVCGCGLVGQPRVKVWRGESVGHVRRCACRRCAGGRTRGTSRRRENKVARLTGGTREPLSGALSGVDGRSGLTVWEETSNESVVRGLRRWWTSKTVTRKVARMMSRQGGERRAFVASWDGRPQVVVQPYEDWADMVRTLTEHGL